ncbi:hypothetical protein PAXRUDRAFT_834250 [Paxillus rubicundulus Ve08.2h10]|uniref:Uncharacterized protein n=1 Tax=Paxillus rubicundulus Ve08.2h10 TaxID=930991 RepID=A0A0D0D656_9AGAM|nr:hypothetical protein PAXRUDRAFT_834250 [Paxillus rubicundulus Ve08.2h10]
MSSSQYPVPPPLYQPSGSATKPKYGSNPSEPLLGRSRSPGGGIYDQPEQGDVPDDFKYGVTVSDSSPEVRAAFVRKVYTILFCQILATCLVAGVLSQSTSAISWVQQHTWSFYVPLFGTLVNLGLLFWKRHSHPLNLVLLSTFTAMEAFSLGVLTAFFDNIIVLQALLITLGVFLGLTLFTLQSKYDFSGLGPWLFGALVALVMTGLVGVFIPFSQTMDLIYAIGGCLIFSGYIVYDTFIITKRLSPDEYIMGAISLYLDFVNLFINILRLLNDLQDR